MICPNKACGFEFEDGLVYCPSCGRLVAPGAARAKLPPDEEELARRRRRMRRIFGLAALALVVAAVAVCAMVFRKEIADTARTLKNRIAPPTCKVHGVRLEDGKCPKVCETCGKHLGKDGKCEDICEIHGVHKADGKCPKVCETCGRHLGKDGKCADVCEIHGVHKADGKCPKVCETCGKHLGEDGKCADVCEIHGVHKADGKCPKCEKDKADEDARKAIEAAMDKALKAFRAKEWKEGLDALSGVAESAIATPELQYYLGQCHEYGFGGAKKSGDAMLKWYRRAAEQGYADAQFSLGMTLMAGDDDLQVDADTYEGGNWLKAAAKQGHQRAIEALKELSDL